MPTFGGQRPGGVLGPFLGTFTGLTPPSPDTYPYPGWALDANGRVWDHLGPNLWTLSLTVGGAYAPGQGGSIPSAKGTAVKFSDIIPTGWGSTALIPPAGLWEMIFLASAAGAPASPFMGFPTTAGWVLAVIVGGTGIELQSTGAGGATASAPIGNWNAPPSFNIVDAWWDGTHLNISVNGNTVAQATPASAPVPNGVLAIGSTSLWAQGSSGETLERASFFEKNATATQRANLAILFQTLNAAGYDELIATIGPAAYYLLQESFGTAMKDASGNGNAGAYNGVFTLAQPGGL